VHVVSALSGPRALVSIAKQYELLFGKTADAHLCVTKAMRTFLSERNISRAENVRVLYDRPPSHFRRLDLNEQHAVRSLFLFVFCFDVALVFALSLCSCLFVFNGPILGLIGMQTTLKALTKSKQFLQKSTENVTLF